MYLRSMRRQIYVLARSFNIPILTVGLFQHSYPNQYIFTYINSTNIYINPFYEADNKMFHTHTHLKVYVEVSLEIALSRNASRSFPVPPDTVVKIFSGFQPPKEVFAFDRHQITIHNCDNSPSR